MNAMDQTTSERARGSSTVSAMRPYAETLAMVGASTLVGMLVAPRWGTLAVDLLYLPAVLASATLYGLRPALAAATGSALAYNFFFTQPVHSFRVTQPDELVTVAILFLVAVVTSQLAARMRDQARSAAAHAARNATIAGLARRLLSCASEQEIGAVACRELARVFHCNSILVAASPEPVVIATQPSTSQLSPGDVAAAAWVLEWGEAAGRRTKPVELGEWLFHPVRSGSNILAALGLARDDGTTPVADDQRDLLDNLIDQVALALERSRLEAEARSAQEQRERNQLRSGLLATIGQDIEPRLSAITDGLNGLRRSGSNDKALVAAIGAEVAKLQRYLSNLLDLGPESDMRPVAAGDVTIDLFRRAVSKSGEGVHLTPKEYAVLAELAKYPGRVLSHAHLLRTAWGPAHEHQIDYLRVAVRGLRQKLEADPGRPRLILNEPGVGYRLVA
jgi:two-component system sensor histidine kinase KdpD